jgi:hypothetical protein
MALEFENPAAFGAVHHLSVACYMLQHNLYSCLVWLEARHMLAQFVQGEITPADYRVQQRSKFDQSRRTWRVTRGEKLAAFATIVWSRTIAGVRLTDAGQYVADVRLWAESVLADTAHLEGV